MNCQLLKTTAEGIAMETQILRQKLNTQAKQLTLVIAMLKGADMMAYIGRVDVRLFGRQINRTKLLGAVLKSVRLQDLQSFELKVYCFLTLSWEPANAFHL
jgi:hypothetical protein